MSRRGPFLIAISWPQDSEGFKTFRPLPPQNISEVVTVEFELHRFGFRVARLGAMTGQRAELEAAARLMQNAVKEVATYISPKPIPLSELLAEDPKPPEVSVIWVSNVEIKKDGLG